MRRYRDFTLGPARPPSRCQRCSNLHSWHQARRRESYSRLLVWTCSNCGWQPGAKG